MGARVAIARALASLLSIFAPNASVNYLAGHVRLSLLQGYDAARNDGPNKRWRPADGLADDMLLRDAKLIRSRARALERDNPNISGALDKIVNNVIFTGIKPQAQLRDDKGKLRRAAVDLVESQWENWESAVDLWDKDQLALRHCWLDGGCFLHFYPDEQLLKQGVVPLGVELLDMDALAISVDGKLPGGAMAYLGREFDQYGRIVAFHFREECLFGGPVHSGRHGVSSSLGKTVRVPAENCLMLMRPDRIGQTLPVSWLHACIMTMRDFDQYQSAERIAARLAAAFAIFLEQSETLSASGNDLSGVPLSGGRLTDGAKLNVNSFMGEGRIDVLPAGTKLAVAENKRPGSNYEPYTRASLRGVSSGIGMSYESYSNDFTGASYSSVRQALLEERRGYKMMQAFLVRKAKFPVWRRFVQWRRLFGFGREDHVPARWQTPGWQWVDPVKDATAAEIRLNTGTASRRDLCAEMGLDFDDTVESLREENEILRESGLLPDDAQSAQMRALQSLLGAMVRKEMQKLGEDNA